MTTAYLLQHLLAESTRRYPEKAAVVFGKKSLAFETVDVLSNKIASVIKSRGVGRGDRVGILVSKSLATVVCVFAVLKSGAAYVPLDPRAPPARLAYIIRDSGISILLTNSSKISSIREMFPEQNSYLKSILLVDCDSPDEDLPTTSPMELGTELVPWKFVISQSSTLPVNPAIETDTAYVLYTSGSTGNPKGVMISHRNSLAFVNWASQYVGLTTNDRVSNHAPLHFDLSIFDIFASFEAGSTVIIVPEEASTFPSSLAGFIEREKITIWYSVPSVLTLLVLYGNLPTHDLSSLRTIIFAGEVFPIKYLRTLMALLPRVRYLNWYGPTETNVCTYFEVSTLDSDVIKPIPIGKPCDNTEVFAITDSGKRVTEQGESGELYVCGPSLMQGYLGDPEKTAKVLVPNPLHHDLRGYVYKTGDIVTIDADGNYVYQGRKDGMIKTRGYRVELGEVETILYDHPLVREVAVLPVPDEFFGNRLRAIISSQKNASLTRDDILSYCSKKLPQYMVPDVIQFVDMLPKTSTGKIDRVKLAQDYPTR